MSQQHWWELYPDRLEYELKALDEAAIEYKRDEEAFSEGVLCLHLSVTVDGEPLNLRAVFPDLYPYFRFEVFAPSLNLSHHQNPLTKNLCLIGRSTELWYPRDTLAFFLTQRLRQVLCSGLSNDPQEVTAIEQHQAEPFSDYYCYEPGTAVIVSGRWAIDTRHTSGTLSIGLQSARTHPLRGAVLKVRDEDGNILAEADCRLQSAFAGGSLWARWVRLPEPPKSLNAKDLFDHLRRQNPYPDKIESHPVGGGRLQVRAGLFPEELSGWRQLDEGWLFACRFEPKESLKVRRKKHQHEKRRKRQK
ncbi:MAG TPA: E2/UBC family protein [Phycisphaerae bacterium]|nr:E2/UBC family protein [Phycisphaerae bacterium]